MKKIYSMMMMLAMMVAALNFTACGDDDDENGGGSSNGNTESTITINGKSYRNYGSNVDQTTTRGLLLELSFIESENPNYMNPFRVYIELPGMRVSELSVGQVCDTEDIDVLSVISDAYEWEALSGSILIKDIKEAELTVQFRNLEIKSLRGGKYTINGTATFHNSVHGPDNKPKPFEET